MPKFDFNKIATTYDDYYKKDFGKRVDLLEKNVVRRLLQQVPRGETLEVGCGTGHWTAFFRHLGFSVIGIDISERMLEMARKKLPNLTCLQANVEDLPFPQESFDNVFAITTLEFVDDRERAFSEIYRVLKVGGYFLLGVLNANSELGKNKDKSETFRNANFFTYQELVDYLSDFGSPIIEGSVVLENGELLDFYKRLPSQQKLDRGAFLVGLVRKSLK